MAKKVLGTGSPIPPELDFMHILARCTERALQNAVDDIVEELIEKDAKLRSRIKSQVRDCMQIADIAEIPEREPVSKEKAADAFALTLDAAIAQAGVDVVPKKKQPPEPVPGLTEMDIEEILGKTESPKVVEDDTV